MNRKFVETPEFRKMCAACKVKDESVFELQRELIIGPEKGELGKFELPVL